MPPKPCLLLLVPRFDRGTRSEFKPNGPTGVLRITRCDRPKKYLIWKPIVMSRVDHQSDLPRAAINNCTLVVVWAMLCGSFIETLLTVVQQYFRSIS